jgi:RNA-directed DNA polymerase
MEGQMSEIPSSKNITTKLNQVAKLAQQTPKMSFTSLSQHIDIDWLKEAYRRTRKDGAAGIDKVTAAEYGQNLEENLQSLLDRAKSGRYRAPAVRRVLIPKGSGKEFRPIGIPTFEDKVLQRAVTMLLEAVYEQDFYEFSYGFRPGRSGRQAIEEIREQIMEMRGATVLEMDIRKYFDTIDHRQLREMLSKRIRDGVLVRLIGKWLKAGVMIEGVIEKTSEGTPQGGVISPLLANVYLHEVLDDWFVKEVLPRMKGQARIIRYADDAVLIFSNENDAHRVMKSLPKRFGKYGLALHPTKTRIVSFKRPPKNGKPPKGPTGGASFDFLGFTHYWAKSRRGNWVVYRKTAKDRYHRALKTMNEWCRNNRHLHVRDQWQKISVKLKGHFNYYGVTGNARGLWQFAYHVTRTWKKWLNRRSQKAGMTWEKMDKLLKRYPLPRPHVFNPHIPLILRVCEPRSRMR